MSFKVRLLSLFMALAMFSNVKAQTVVDIIVGSPEHNTLENLVIAAGLAPTLSQAGPYTVFAPTDAAFSALPPSLLNSLNNDPTGALADALRYHVLEANVASGDLSNGLITTTFLGDDILVTIKNGDVFINQTQVTMADIPASNGVVHVIDAVLVPGETVVDIVVASDEHTTLETAVVASELGNILTDPLAEFTVFAPTDAAFNALPAGVLDNLLLDPTGALADVLLYHTIDATVESGDLSNGQIAMTVNGDNVIVTLSNGNVFINQTQVTTADIPTDNGVVHVIDAVLVPGNTVVDAALSVDTLSTLVTAVVAAEVAPVLTDPFAEFTIFAPTDAAFANLPAGVLDDLLADPTGDLANVLTYHALDSEVFAADLSNGQIATAVFDDDIIVTINSDGDVFINQAQVEVTDVQTDNGVVHIIDAVLVPGETVVDIALDSPVHTTLVSAVVQSGLVPLLVDPFLNLTVFAPTNDAFDALPAGVLDGILADEALLVGVLAYHAIPVEVPSADITNGLAINTLAGNTLITTLTGAGDLFIDQALVTGGDLDADNGVVHVIDDVLVPVTTVVDVAIGSGVHQNLVNGVVFSELAPVLTEPFAEYTLFAPTDDAFNSLPTGVVDDLFADPTGALADVLVYHTLDAQVLSGDLTNGQIATTINTDDVIVTLTSNSEVFINQAQVSTPDIEVGNGVVHVIDDVLVPGETVVDIALGTGNHNTLVQAVVAAEIAPVLTEPFATYTIFAPTDAAFDALPAGVLDDLLADPLNDLTPVLTYHALDTEVLSGDLTNGLIANPLNQDDYLIATVTGAGEAFINQAQVTLANVQGDNGVVHVIDDVLVPSETVVDVVVASDVHNTLETAVIESELVPTLMEPFAEYTLFAPTDAAFDDLPDGALDALLADPTGALTDVLLYHALDSRVLSNTLFNGQTATTIQGSDIEVTIDASNDVFINQAQVVTPDVDVANGVVHVIDAVLSLPVNVQDLGNADFDISVFPNPTTDYINVNVEEQVTIQLIDMNGRLMNAWNGGVGTNNLNVSQLPAGNYFLLLTDENANTYRQMIAVQR